MNKLRIFIAHGDDTLRDLASKYNVSLERLLALNSDIVDPDSAISGRPIRLPKPSAVKNQASSQKKRETWIPLTSLEEMEQTEYDVIIVGTGAGGGAVLWRLAQQLGNRGKRIGIIERGGLLLPTHALNINTLRSENYIRFLDVVKSAPPNVPWKQVYALGGRTLVWGFACPRMSASDLMRWPVSMKEMGFYYNLAEKIMNVSLNVTKGALLTQTLLGRLHQNGFTSAIDTPLAINTEPFKYETLNTNIYFSSIELLGEAMNRTSIDLAINSRATKVLTEKNKISGLRVTSSDKRTFDLKAKNIVLSASTLGSAQILLNSDIQGEAIGHYLSGHSRANAIGKVSRDEFPESLGPCWFLIPGTESCPYQILFTGAPVGDKIDDPIGKDREIRIQFNGYGEIQPRFDNYISLDPQNRDEYGVPELQVNFTYSEQDKLVIQKLIDAEKRASDAMQVPLISEGSNPVFEVPEVFDHEVGTCRMGNDPFTSATNRYGQVHGIQGLYVADNSVQPTSGTANPTLTTVALAIRTADYISEQLK